jgi:hypothetical protein
MSAWRRHGDIGDALSSTCHLVGGRMTAFGAGRVMNNAVVHRFRPKIVVV